MVVPSAEVRYLGMNMDEIATAAAVSKQTVYKHFADKERLFAEIIYATIGRVIDELVRGATLAVHESDDVERDLVALARQLTASIWHPDVLRLRRLVIGEAARFPQLGEAYFTQAFDHGIAALAPPLQQHAAPGRRPPARRATPRRPHPLGAAQPRHVHRRRSTAPRSRPLRDSRRPRLSSPATPLPSLRRGRPPGATEGWFDAI